MIRLFIIHLIYNKIKLLYFFISVRNHFSYPWKWAEKRLWVLSCVCASASLADTRTRLQVTWRSTVLQILLFNVIKRYISLFIIKLKICAHYFIPANFVVLSFNCSNVPHQVLQTWSLYPSPENISDVEQLFQTVSSLFF